MSAADTRRKVLFVVSSLMGAGHLQRTLLLANAVNEAGGKALVVSGGRAPEYLGAGAVSIAHLPPVWADGLNYSQLITPEGVADESYFAARGQALCAQFDTFAPDVLVTELFPFGRRALSHEFLTLLAHAHGRARVFASIRDVLEPKKKPKRHLETADQLRRWYDGVLVHGDLDLIPLDATWPLASELGACLHYTGYVCAPKDEPIPSDDVLVSVGGGVIGRSILTAAIEAARGGVRPWRLRVGGPDASAVARDLQQQAEKAPVIVEPASADYRRRLAGCACSVSLFGYNTATDLLISAPAAVISPMDEGGEREQIIRADAFARVPGFVRLPKVTPEDLRNSVEKAIWQGRPSPGAILTDGAERSASLLLA